MLNLMVQEIISRFLNEFITRLNTRPLVNCGLQLLNKCTAGIVWRARAIKRCYGMTTTLSIKAGVIRATRTERGVLLVHMRILLVISHLTTKGITLIYFDVSSNIHKTQGVPVIILCYICISAFNFILLRHHKFNFSSFRFL
jgi:hypothetical protein